MKYLKIFEEFGEFKMDEVSREESNEMNNRDQYDDKYREGYIDADIKHTKNQFKDFGRVSALDVDRYSNTNNKVRRLKFQFGYDLDEKKFYDLLDFVLSRKKKPETLKDFTFYISKYEMGDDEPQYKMTCNIEDSKGNDIWKYFLFEESDFKFLLQDPKKYVEIIVNEYLLD